MPPDLLPVLAKGKHRSPRRGACFMEFASLLAGERFSDHPKCTHPVLAAIARTVNDCTTDEGRPQLATLVPSVIGTAYDNPLIAPELVRLCCRRALRVAPGDWRFVVSVALLSAERQLSRLQPDGVASVASESGLSADEIAAAQRFMHGLWGSHRYYQRKGAARAAQYAIMSMATVSGDATDQTLRETLAEAVDLCRAIGSAAESAAAPAEVAAESWTAACSLVGVAKR